MLQHPHYSSASTPTLQHPRYSNATTPTRFAATTPHSSSTHLSGCLHTAHISQQNLHCTHLTAKFALHTHTLHISSPLPITYLSGCAARGRCPPSLPAPQLHQLHLVAGGHSLWAAVRRLGPLGHDPPAAHCPAWTAPPPALTGSEQCVQSLSSTNPLFEEKM